MRFHFLSITLAHLVLTTAAVAASVSKINVIVSPQTQGSFDIKIELRKGLFNKTYQTIERSALHEGVNEIILEKSSKINDIKLTLKLVSGANLKGPEVQAAEISGIIEPGGLLKKDETDFVGDKLSARIDCSGLVQSSVHGAEIDLDLSRFLSLSDCSGKDLAEYSPYHIGRRNVSDGANWFSLSDDEAMGRDYANQFILENGDKILPLDHPATIYLQDKMDHLASLSDMPNLKPKVRVINADVLNAFALPGGYVFVFRGLMEKSPSEAAMMGVLGHEWAHVTARHGTRGITRSLKTMVAAVSISLVTQVWAEVTKDKVKQLVLPLVGGATLLGAQLKLLSRGREQELEADRLGSQYALLAGYHPRGIGDMFEVFKKEAGGSSTSLEKLLSTHPDHDTRINRNHIYSSLFYPVKNDYITTSDDYRYALAAMSSRPMPAPEKSVQIASSFIKGLQDQQDTVVTNYMQGYISEIMKDKTKK